MTQISALSKPVTTHKHEPISMFVFGMPKANKTVSRPFRSNRLFQVIENAFSAILAARCVSIRSEKHPCSKK
ncbi:hypothetical protein ALC53_11438 [Atta colombica]|uniref:Uncharacterized protein n=1 Tax=Atta colombica TaxID=520822 RepID=A0A151HZB7_9HYME|nr:hypothetical protein ALC53_11438 [Atta colombica]